MYALSSPLPLTLSSQNYVDDFAFQSHCKIIAQEIARFYFSLQPVREGDRQEESERERRRKKERERERQREREKVVRNIFHTEKCKYNGNLVCKYTYMHLLSILYLPHSTCRRRAWCMLLPCWLKLGQIQGYWHTFYARNDRSSSF